MTTLLNLVDSAATFWELQAQAAEQHFLVFIGCGDAAQVDGAPAAVGHLRRLFI